MKEVVKIKRIMMYLLLGMILYLLIGVILPFLFHPKISEKTKRKVSQLDFTGSEAGDERVRILADNGEALKERIRLISQAEKRIILSTFEFRTDESGKDMLAALRAAAQRRVQIQLLVDGMAATIRMPGNEYFTALSALETAEIRIYNPISLLKPWQLMGRMHDKYLIVDDDAYILGGRNTYDYFLGDHDGYINYDWDALVYQAGEVCGESMLSLIDYFETVWNHSLCRTYKDECEALKRDSVIAAGATLDNRYEMMQKEHPAWFEACDYEAVTKPANQIKLVTNPIHCYAKEPIVFYTIVQLMGQAEEEVRFHTPYIICNDWMLQCLQEACQKVPDIYMMTNSVANNGNPFGAMDYKYNKKKILRTGVKSLEYDGGVSYHGKCFVIDDRFSGVGSFNWDMRSSYIDTEMMLVIDSPEVTADLKREMSHYEADALAVSEGFHDFIQKEAEPQKIGFVKNIVIIFLRMFAGWARFLM